MVRGDNLYCHYTLHSEVLLRRSTVVSGSRKIHVEREPFSTVSPKDQVKSNPCLDSFVVLLILYMSSLLWKKKGKSGTSMILVGVEWMRKCSLLLYRSLSHQNLSRVEIEEPTRLEGSWTSSSLRRVKTPNVAYGLINYNNTRGPDCCVQLSVKKPFTFTIRWYSVVRSRRCTMNLICKILSYIFKRSGGGTDKVVKKLMSLTKLKSSTSKLSSLFLLDVSSIVDKE